MRIQHIQATKDKTKKIEFVCLEDDGSIIDLTGLSGNINIIKQEPDDSDMTIVTKAATLTTPSEGKCEVVLDDSDMNIEVNQYIYRLEFTFNPGDTRVLFTGDFIVLGDDENDRIEQVKQKYGLSYNYYILKEALSFAQKEVNKTAFENVIQDTRHKNTEIEICHNVMDTNFDGVIDANDINIFQYLTQSPYTVEDLNGNISSITLDNPYKAFVTMDTEYPDDNYVLRVEYKRGNKEHTEIAEYIDKLEEWYIIKYLFENLDVYKLQHGMTSKNINGIDVTFDTQGITDFQKKIQQHISYYIMKTLPYAKCRFNNKGSGGLLKSVLVSKSYSD